MLTPGRYVGAEEVEDEGEPFEEKMTRLVGELNAQFAESAKLEQAIRSNLDRFRLWRLTGRHRRWRIAWPRSVRLPRQVTGINGIRIPLITAKTLSRTIEPRSIRYADPDTSKRIAWDESCRQVIWCDEKGLIGEVVISRQKGQRLAQRVHNDLRYLACATTHSSEVSIICCAATRNSSRDNRPGRQQNRTSGRSERFALEFPPLSEQKAIAAVLGALDDKIELNRRMNATLEAMARALFQSWFVDFDPVRAKLDGRQPTGLDPATAALFPNEFEDSELGHIPEDWITGKLGDICNNSRRGVQPSEIAAKTPYIALEHMPRRCIALGDWDESADVASGKSAFMKGEILFGKLRPYFHKVGVAPFDGVCSTDILVLAPKSREWFAFLLGHASSDELVSFTDLASTGTKMPRTNWSDISSFKVAIPPKTIAASFSKLIQPMIERIIANLFESRSLASLRDTMLPKLLSGEIEVLLVNAR